MKRIPLLSGLLFATAPIFAQVIPPDTTQRITSTTGAGASYDLGVSGSDGSFSIVRVGAAPRLTMDGSGNVTVLQNLTVNGAFSATNFAGGALTGGATGLTLNAGGTNQSITLTPTGTGYTLLNGNVGIGLTTPTAKLDVAGAGKFQGALTTTSTTASTSPTTGALVVGGGAGIAGDLSVGGKIGVGLGTAPGAALHVLQDARIQGNLTVDGVINISSGNVVANTTSDTLVITSTTQSTGYATGAVTVAGGVGITKNLNVGGILNAANLQIGGQSFDPANYVQQSGGVINGGTTGLTINAGAANQNLVFDADGIGRVEVRDLLAITNFTGVQYLLMGNQDSLGANNPAILRAANGNFEFGRGNSWVAAGGTFTPNVTFLNNGNVGVGTTNPQVRLHVTSNAAPSTGLSIENTGSGGRWYSLVTTQDGASIGGGKFSVYDNSAGLHRLSIDSGGNVGVGTTTPLSKLHVQGIGRFGLNDPNTNNLGGILVAAGTGTGGARQYWLGASNPTTHNNNNFLISDYDGGTNAPLLTILGSHNGTAGGNVGIGTTAPTAKLEVSGPAAFTGWIGGTGAAGSALSIFGSKSDAWGKDLTIKDGYVGLGTTTPSNDLSIIQKTDTQSKAGLRVFRSNGSSSGVLFQGGDNNTYLFNYGGGLKFYTNGSVDAMTVASGGNVGIGIATPLTKLDVAGAGHFGLGTGVWNDVDNLANTTRGLSIQDANAGANVAIAVGQNKLNSTGLIWNGSEGLLYTYGNAHRLRLGGSAISFGVGLDNEAVTLAANSNLGIGTTTPTERLVVAGNAIITGSLASDINGTAEASLTLGSSNPPGQGGSLRLASSQGGQFRFSNEAGKFTLRREGGLDGPLLTFETSVAEFGSSIKSFGLDVQNSAIRNVAAPFLDTDAANMLYVKNTNPFEWSAPSSIAHLKTGITHLGIGTQTPTRTLEVSGMGPLFYIEYPSHQPRIRYPAGAFQYAALQFQHTAYENGWGAEIRNEDVGSAGGNLSFFTTPKNSTVIDMNAVPERRVEITPDGLMRLYHKKNESFGWEFSVQDASGGNDGSGAGGLALRQAAKAHAGTERDYNAVTRFWLSPTGEVGIGTTNTNGYKLSVNGTIHTKEVVVDLAGWSDYVFADDYKLAPLAEVEAHIKAEKHLPGVPSAREVSEKGVNIGQMQATLLAKVEELTLHMIAQEKRIQKLEAENVALRQR